MTTYKPYQNFIAEQLKALNRDYFYCRKQAFDIHTQICTKSECMICACANKVSRLSYNPGNFSRYMFADYPQPTIKTSKSTKTVTFAENTRFPKEDSFRKVYLNRKLVEKACLYCTSLTEINLLTKM